MKIRNYLIKPASGLCNMRCKYCFYVDEMNKRSCQNYGLMTPETMKALIQHAFQDKPDYCTFAFQGGEPTLAGLDYFRNFLKTVKDYNTNHIPVSYALQTNGYAIDDEWAAFLSQENFLVGVSLDGYPSLHNLYRVDAAGKGTDNRVLKTIALFRQYNVEYNILTVVTAQTARHAEKVYHYFAKQGFHYQQYIPCLDPLGEPHGKEDYSLTPELYSRFLKTIFDLWYADVIQQRQPYNRYFENLLGMLLGNSPEACNMHGHCNCQMVIEADGRVYPCDFYVLDSYCIGDITKDSVEQIEANYKRLHFTENSLVKVPECLNCRWYSLCRGGCRRECDTGNHLERSYYCKAYQEFFEYAYPRLSLLANAIRFSNSV